MAATKQQYQSGVTIAAPNAPYIISHDIPRPPAPGPGEMLVKSLYVGLNPVEDHMHHYGLLVTSFPAVLGCDASGVVLAVGEGVGRFRVGDYVLGCTTLGVPGRTTFQETFLMREETAIRRVGEGVGVDGAAGVGVGLYTAALGLFAGLGLEFPEAGSQVASKDEWVVIYGASGAVGQFAVQLAHLAGYKVLAASSPSKASISEKNGADAQLNHRLSEAEQLEQIKKATGGNFSRVLEASGEAYDVGVKALEQVSSAKGKKILASTNDWTEWPAHPSVEVYRIKLGEINRLDGPVGRDTTKHIASWVERFEGHLRSGGLRPVEFEVFGVEGWQGVVDGVAYRGSGKAARKVVVKVQDE